MSKRDCEVLHEIAAISKWYTPCRFLFWEEKLKYCSKSRMTNVEENFTFKIFARICRYHLTRIYAYIGLIYNGM